jgi:hypothetical protein
VEQKEQRCHQFKKTRKNSPQPPQPRVKKLNKTKLRNLIKQSPSHQPRFKNPIKQKAPTDEMRHTSLRTALPAYLKPGKGYLKAR